MAKRPRLLIEDWLPAAAIGVECMRERGSASALAPHTYLHVWWARRPLTAARAAVLGSLLPADFPRETFERLLGFGRPSAEIVAVRKLMDTGFRVPGGFGYERAFKSSWREDDMREAHNAAQKLWGDDISVIDPMAGGGSIPLEAARMGFRSLANEYNPVACTVLEATVDYPLRFGLKLAERARHWGRVWGERVEKRLAEFYPKISSGSVHAYIFAHTVPCPDTQHPTPLVPDWHLLKPKTGVPVVAEPIVDAGKGTWRTQVREIGGEAGRLATPPRPTYSDGKGISLFTNHQIPADYIKAKAQAGEMKSALYAVAIKTPQGLRFQPPSKTDLDAVRTADEELAKLRPNWEKQNVIPLENRVQGDCDRSYVYGLTKWTDMFAPRQLLCFGVLAEELKKLRAEIVKKEGAGLGEAVIHMLAIGFDKFANWNCILASWNPPAGTARSLFDRHDFSFKATWCEMAPVSSGSGLGWALNNILDAFESLCVLPRDKNSLPVEITMGTATNLPQLDDKCMSAVIVDPPYADNVQYAELADFFYVWLKRTQGHRRPEWFSTYLCENDQEAVVNVSRHRDRAAGRSAVVGARERAHAHYQKLMSDTFRESRRILCDDGALTVMFTHKKQEAWEALFSSLIEAGFTITATWPVKTEGAHSLHQAKKNAAQSTVILVARKRPPKAGVGYFDGAMKHEIRERARESAARLAHEGLNAVDQLVGSFGPAMEVYSRYDEVKTDTGESVSVSLAIDEAADAVSTWRIEQLAARGLDGVEPEGRFALLCWDVLGAAEFRFNEAKLLGHAVGMDVESLTVAGLVSKTGDKIKMLSARDRRRDRALEPDEVTETLFGPVTAARRRTRTQALKVHPNDPRFRTALDLCHALALRYIEAGGGGIGNARALAAAQQLTRDSAAARLMEALVHAAPVAVRVDRGKTSAGAQFPEFRAWHALLKPLFGIVPPDWTVKQPAQGDLLRAAEPEAEHDADEDDEAEE